MNNTISINEDKLNSLSVELYDYAERINGIFNQINDLIDSSSDFFLCDVDNSVIRKFSDLKTEMKAMVSNISKYSSDMIKVKNKFKNGETEITVEVKKHTSSVEKRNFIEEVK